MSPLDDNVNLDRVWEVRRLLRDAAELWVDIFGDDRHNEWQPSIEFMTEVEHAYWGSFERQFPGRFEEGRHHDSTIRRLIGGDPPAKGIGTIYIHLGVDREVLYIGQTTNMIERQKHHQRKSPWWDQIVSLDFISPVKSLNEVERACIKLLRPLHNTVHNRWSDA